MIAYIEGRLAEIWGSACIVVTDSGLGYELAIPSHTMLDMKSQAAEGAAVRFFVRTEVREDALELYGFATWDERQTFVVLRSISKVGAKTALAILSEFRPDDLRRLVLEDDATSLTRVSGVGAKTAQHIFLELKYKLKVESVPAASLSAAGTTLRILPDVVAALANLGYSESDATQVVKEVLHADPSLDMGGAVRAALKVMLKRTR
ncbi:MAG: Holliday junction branch migration protein RuvA [Pseudomonadota bacterium]